MTHRITRPRGILVVGGGVVSKDNDGCFTAKAPVADYINELAQLAGRCIWMVPGTAPLAYTTRLDTPRVDVRLMSRGSIATPKAWYNMLRSSRESDMAVLFLPAILPLIPAITLAKRHLRMMAVYLAGDYTMPTSNQHGLRAMAHQAVLKAGFEYCTWLPDYVIARGKHLSKLARRRNPRVVETIPIGHVMPQTPERANRARPADTRRLLFVGKVLRSKGVDDLLHAMKVIDATELPFTVQLDVIGAGDALNDMQQLSRALGLSHCVRFLGWVDGSAELHGYLAESDALVVPTSTHPEGVPRVIDEALQHGLPVIATRVGGIPTEFSEGEVVLVRPSAPAELAGAIAQVLTDDELRGRLGDAGLRRSAAFARYGSAARQHYELLSATGTSERAIEIAG